MWAVPWNVRPFGFAVVAQFGMTMGSGGISPARDGTGPHDNRILYLCYGVANDGWDGVVLLVSLLSRIDKSF